MNRDVAIRTLHEAEVARRKAEQERDKLLPFVGTELEHVGWQSLAHDQDGSHPFVHKHFFGSWDDETTAHHMKCHPVFVLVGGHLCGFRRGLGDIFCDLPSGHGGDHAQEADESKSEYGPEVWCPRCGYEVGSDECQQSHVDSRRTGREPVTSTTDAEASER